MALQIPDARRSRIRLLQVAAGTVGLVTLATVAWTYLNSSSGASSPGEGSSDRRPARRTDSGDQDIQDEQTEKTATTSRPTLSLSVPPSYDAEGTFSQLHSLIASLSQHFVVHLIVPGREEHSDGLSAAAEQAHSQLVRTFRDVQAFDPRRTLLYSTREGRSALARSLACDAHVEVLLPSAAASGEATEEDVQAYRSRLDLLRKACGLLVLVALPGHEQTGAVAVDERTSQILAPYSGGIHVPGVRVFDLRDIKEQQEAWKEAAIRVGGLKKGWR